MFAPVGGQVCRAGKRCWTLVALVRFLSSVDPHVLRQDAGSGKCRPTLTLEGVVGVMSLHVHLNTAQSTRVTGRSCGKYHFGCDKTFIVTHVFVMTKHMFVMTNHMFVMTKHFFCHDKNMLAATKLLW